MTTLEQAKRLKDAGWKSTKSVTCEFYYDNYEDAPVSYVNDFDDIESAINSGGRIIDGPPDEKEMMGFLMARLKCIVIRQMENSVVIQNSLMYTLCEGADFTEALVLACEAVLKQAREGK